MTLLLRTQRVALLCCLLSMSMQAQAMTEQEASGNLMYFAFAMKQGEACKQMGFTAMAALQGWEKRNGDVLARSLRRVQDYAAETQKLTDAQAKEVALGLFIRYQETFDREMAPSLGKASCMRFGETLGIYEGKLVAR